jgi:hypothetical protein
VRDENVLIGDVRRISTEPEEFECDMIVDSNHPFFFEHPLDHVPGMMFTEAGRQVGIAISHLFLGVPFGTQFISREYKVFFESFAELIEPITIRARFNNKCYRQGAFSEAILQGEFFQCGKVVTSMEGDWRMYSPEIYQRYRVHEKNQRK